MIGKERETVDGLCYDHFLRAWVHLTFELSDSLLLTTLQFSLSIIFSSELVSGIASGSVICVFYYYNI